MRFSSDFDPAALAHLTFPAFRGLLGAAGGEVVRLAAFGRTGLPLALGLARYGEGEGRLLSIAVVPPMRGQGIAKALLAELCDRLSLQAAHRIIASVPIREGGVPFGFRQHMLRQGWREVGEPTMALRVGTRAIMDWIDSAVPQPLPSPAVIMRPADETGVPDDVRRHFAPKGIDGAPLQPSRSVVASVDGRTAHIAAHHMAEDWLRITAYLIDKPLPPLHSAALWRAYLGATLAEGYRTLTFATLPSSDRMFALCVKRAAAWSAWSSLSCDMVLERSHG